MCVASDAEYVEGYMELCWKVRINIRLSGEGCMLGDWMGLGAVDAGHFC